MEERSTREEAEEQIIELLEWICEIYEQYNPHADYLTLVVNKTCIGANNSYWGEDSDYPINFFKLRKG